MKLIKIFLSQASHRRSTITSHWCGCINTTWNDPFLPFKLIHLIQSFRPAKNKLNHNKWTAFTKWTLTSNWTPWKPFPFIKPTSRYATVYWPVDFAIWLSGLLRRLLTSLCVWGGGEIIIGAVWRNHSEKKEHPPARSPQTGVPQCAQKWYHQHHQPPMDWFHINQIHKRLV